MRNKNSWVLLLTLTLMVIGVILSNQSSSVEAYTASLEAQSEVNLLSLWRNNDERLQELQDQYYQRQSEYEDLLTQTSQGKVSIESFSQDIQKTRVFNGDVESSGPGLIIRFPGDKPITLRELLDVINELHNSGAEAVAINGNRVTAHSFFKEIPYDRGQEEYLLQHNQSLLNYPLIIQAIGDYANLHNGLTIVGGIIDKLRSYGIQPEIEESEELILPASNDKNNYPAVPLNLN